VLAKNEIGSSPLSVANSILFANVPDAPATLQLTPTADPAQIRADWSAPLQVNGDAVHGYRVFVDDGLGSTFQLAHEGNQASTYTYTITELTCGLLYHVKVTAKNVAGEGTWIMENVWLGEPPSEPLEPELLEIYPEVSLTIGW
jgi:hypothetical protein